MKTSEEIRKAFTDFWMAEPRNAKVVPNVSLVPNNDPTLLFVNSGMFPLNPYLSGQPHPLGTRLCNIQRCLRTLYDEMLEVGDNRHTLMFEMMGDWSLGDFTKVEQIPWIMEFWVEVCGMDPKRLYVSVFEGDDVVGRDDEAIEIWKKAFAKYGVEAQFAPEVTMIPKDLKEGENWKYRIFPYPKKKNWWQRAADSPGELGGPTSEMFYDMGTIEKEQEKYHVNDDSGRFIEIGNNVFMEYRYGEDGKWHPLENKNIDFGGGFERVVMIAQGKSDIFESDIYEGVLSKISQLSGKEYKSDGKENEYTRYFRILADHSRAATFIIGDGVVPSNKDQGYILRRFIRRLVRYGSKLEMSENFTKEIAGAVIEKLGDVYPHLVENKEVIFSELDKEESKFRRTLQNGLRELEKVSERLKATGESLDGKSAFFIYETYGFPLEMTLDELGVGEEEAKKIEKEFKEVEKAHREMSKAGAEQKFKGGLADQSVETTKLHTAHHLLLAALQQVVDGGIKQRGSNITADRLRIDFNYADKLTDEQIKQVEEIVNSKIEQGLEVRRVELPKEVAENIGAQMEFGQKYPDLVSVYFIGLNSSVDPEKANPNDYFSAEFCGGPHVENTSQLGAGGKRFKIQKQESVGAGVRRLKGSIE